jgi:hypothetical protein
VVVVAYGLDIVVVPVLVVVSSGSSSSVVALGETGDGVSGGNKVALELPVGVNDDVVVVVRRMPDDDADGDGEVNDVPDGAVACRDVCSTAKTMRTTASAPATPAAIATPGRSCHRPGPPRPV